MQSPPIVNPTSFLRPSPGRLSRLLRRDHCRIRGVRRKGKQMLERVRARGKEAIWRSTRRGNWGTEWRSGRMSGPKEDEHTSILDTLYVRFY